MEPIEVTANHVVSWFVDGVAGAGHQPTFMVNFGSTGTKRIQARTKSGERATIQFNVVAPSLTFRKVRDVTVENQWPTEVGVAMELEISFTPMSVCFGGLEFRELGGPPDQVWGYFTGRAPRHVPPTNWVGIDLHNRLTQRDTAAWHIRPQDWSNPIAAGGYQWQIPGELRVGAQTLRLGGNCIESVRIDPTQQQRPFRGKITVWKGGCQAIRNY